MKGNLDSRLIPGILAVESGSWTLESGIQLKESGVPLRIVVRNPSSTDKVPGIQNPRLSWIPLRGVTIMSRKGCETGVVYRN